MKEIKYKDIVSLGFSRTDCHDQVYIDQHGYDWFFMEKKLYKKILVYWDPENRIAKIRKMGKEGEILSEMTIPNLEALKQAIDFFKPKK